MRGKRVREVLIEREGDLKLLVGGKHGYVRVRYFEEAELSLCEAAHHRASSPLSASPVPHY